MTKTEIFFATSSVIALVACIVTWLQVPRGIGAFVCHIWLGCSISFLLTEHYQFSSFSLGLKGLASKLDGLACILIVDWVFNGPITKRDPGVLILGILIAIPCSIYIVRRKQVVSRGA